MPTLGTIFCINSFSQIQDATESNDVKGDQITYAWFSDQEVAEKVESVVPGGLELVLLVGAAEWGW